MWDQLTSTSWGQAAVGGASFVVMVLIWLYLTGLVGHWLERRVGRIHLQSAAPFLKRTVALLRWWGLFASAFYAVSLAGAMTPVLVQPLTKGVLGTLIILLGASVTEGIWRLAGHFLGAIRAPQPLIKFTQLLALLSFGYLTLLIFVAELDLSVTPLLGFGALGLIPLALLLQGAANDLFFYFRLLRRQHLRVGDFVRLENGVTGHILSMSWQDVAIRSRSNNLVVVPNRRMSRLLVTNLHLPEKRISLTITIPVVGGPPSQAVELILKEELELAVQDLPGLVSDAPWEVRMPPGGSMDGHSFIAVCQVEDAELAERVEQDIVRRIAVRFRKEAIQSPLLDSLSGEIQTGPPPKSTQDLEVLVRTKFADTLFLVASNREPYLHNFDGRSVRWSNPASGMTTALDPVMRVLGGVWIAVGSGNADREVSGAEGRVRVPPDSPGYTLRRLWLSREQEDKSYGFSNRALWPLCHTVYVRPVFDAQEWKTYEEVNRLFADAILDEVGGKKAFIFLQDYHLALVPRLLKEAGANVTVAHFWHIPWPMSEAFQTCPWAEKILEGLLGNDLLGFHTRFHCNNFLETVDRTLESRVDYGKYSVMRQNHETLVRPFPISIDFEAISNGVMSPSVQRERTRLRQEMGISGGPVGLGVDRLDYTKGIPERLKGLDHLFTTHPRYKGRFTFIQVGVPSRSQIKEYQDVDSGIQHLVDEINRRHSSGSWQPIIYLRRYLSSTPLWALYSMADLCVVSSLHDGMNLVAKEYVAARANNDGVLVLSKFTGAAAELTGALLVNPYDTEGLARAIASALDMPRSEQAQRMQRMRIHLQENDIYRWAIRVLNELTRLEVPATHRGHPWSSPDVPKSDAAVV